MAERFTNILNGKVFSGFCTGSRNNAAVDDGEVKY
jgi:hypothetical protein